MIGGALISFATVMSIRWLGLLNMAVLGRLLTPADFGIVALAMVVIGFSEALMNRQFDLVLIREQATERSKFDTAFTMSVLAGLLAGLFVLAMAWPMARIMNQPELTPVLMVLALAPVLAGLRNTYFVKYQMQLNMLPRAATILTSRVMLTVVAVICALVFANYWAIVAGTVAMYFTYTALTFLLWRELPSFSLEHWREQFRFGGWLTAAGAVGFLGKRVPTLIMGRALGPADTGLYHMGREIATTLATQLVNPMRNALFPGLAAIKDDAARMRRGYLLVQQSLMGLSLPIGIGMAVTAPELVRVGLGLQWMAIVPIIQILAPVASIMSLNIGVQAVVFIKGDTRGLFIRASATLLFGILACGTGVWLGGMMGLVLGNAATLLLGLGLTLRMAVQAGAGRLFDPLTASWRSFGAAGAMAAAVLLLPLGTVPAAELAVGTAALHLGAKVALGMAVYGAAHLGLWAAAGRPEGFETHLLKVLGGILRRLRQKLFGRARPAPGE